MGTAPAVPAQCATRIPAGASLLSEPLALTCCRPDPRSVAAESARGSSPLTPSLPQLPGNGVLFIKLTRLPNAHCGQCDREETEE